MNNLKKREQYIGEELKPWTDKGHSGEEPGHFSIKGFKGNSYNDSFDEPENGMSQSNLFLDIKSLVSHYTKADDLKCDKTTEEIIYYLNKMNLLKNVNLNRDGQQAFLAKYKEAEFGKQMRRKHGIPELSPSNENMIPRPCPKTKCLECGEEVCDSINFKVGHLYNKHNCKPSVGDYKAKNMMKKYFPVSVKEGFESKMKYDFVEFNIDEILSSNDAPSPRILLNHIKLYIENGNGDCKEWWCENLERSIDDAIEEYGIKKTTMFNHIKRYIKEYEEDMGLLDFMK